MTLALVEERLVGVLRNIAAQKAEEMQRPIEIYFEIRKKAWPINNAVRRHFMRHSKLNKYQFERLDMFFAPLVIPACLSRPQVNICIEIYARMCPPGTDYGNEELMALKQSIDYWHAWKSAAVDEHFIGHLSEVLQEKLWFKQEMREARKEYEARHRPKMLGAEFLASVGKFAKRLLRKKRAG